MNPSTGVWIILTYAQVCFFLFVQAKPSFIIDFENNTFLKDGKPFQYLSGNIHYFRVPNYYWADRLAKIQAAGMDAIETYVAWNVHEPQPGVYDFQGQQDLFSFLTSAQDHNLLVILRVGPYICAEWEYGGLPAWLLADNIPFTVRKMDNKYIAAVDRWLGVFLPKVKPYLYSNGGPVIMAQVENEYGSYQSVDCGHDYMSHLRDVFRKHLGDDVILFSTDGNAVSLLKCGTIDGVYATVDFGPTEDTVKAFADMRKWNPKGPLVNSESYTGWLDYWGSGHAHTDVSVVMKSITSMRSYGASASLYMFEGGTSFGYMNGADPVHTYSSCPTSYDYDAVLTEAGDITEKYMALRNFTSTYKKLPAIPPDTSKYAYGEVTMKRVGTVLDKLSVISPEQPMRTTYPVNMEQSKQYYGFVMYRHLIDTNYPTSVLEVKGIRDRGYVLLDGRPIGMLDRNGATSFNMLATKGQQLDIIVENQGRINFGSEINDNRKGIISNVTIAGQPLVVWDMYPLNFSKLFNDVHSETSFSSLRNSEESSMVYQPTIYRGEFKAPSNMRINLADTFLRPCGWFKGQAFINGFNLGRYWPSKGPQVTLYVPGGVLLPAPHSNVLVMVELERSPSSSSTSPTTDSVSLVDKPLLNSNCFEKESSQVKPSRHVNMHRIST